MNFWSKLLFVPTLFFCFLFLNNSATAQFNPLIVANKCEEPVFVIVYARSDCPSNGGTQIALPGVWIQPQSVHQFNPVFPANINPNSFWNAALGSATIATVPVWAQMRPPITYCPPAPPWTWPLFFSGALTGAWYINQYSESIVFQC